MKTIITLPDGSRREFDSPVTAYDVAEDISAGLARAAVAARVDGELCDVTAPIAEGEHAVALVTDRDDEALEVLRHSGAHVLAQAVVRLYGEGVQYTIGPALVDDFQYGFYYDFDLPQAIGPDDLETIEQEMARIIAEKLPVERLEMPVDRAKEEMTKLGQHYKVEMIDDLIRDEGVTTVSLYRQGEFLDMCRGPHLPTTSRLKAIKLLTSAGAYWRGDEANTMLTRIYGVAFFDKKDLAAHLERIEEARKRDHRVIGKQLGLFLISDAVGPGLPLWMPNGATIRLELENWLRGELIERGYQPVYTPHIGKLDLFRTSGHYPYYKDSQFPPIEFGEDEGYLLKPMNCPHHIQIYKAAQHSYRELPVRLAEFGTVYRFEQSGELNGLTRVRGFCQDDAHIFCTPEQLEAEIESCVELTQMVLATLGLNDYRVRLGLRDPESDKCTGDAEHWNLAERNIRNVVTKLGMDYTDEIGEAAFYGPKIDFIVTDCLGREWQLGTVQVDYNLPERFGLEYIGADNAAHRPIMVHRAPLGSPERFIGILIEHFGGAFPLWLAPCQAAVLPVSDKTNAFAATVADALKAAGVRVELDDSAEKIGAKIRRATLAKTPYMAVVGQREADGNTIAVRHRTEGEVGTMAVDEFIAKLRREIDAKGASQPLTEGNE
ncbi:MAG: threonine--tRNA ligase [Planctomycetota bacterium]|jgi:threonyl-tRNA synthetase